MKTESLTSVIIPAYNMERFVERTLLSALRQTHSSLEIIVVDDGSTDNTRRIAERVAQTDPRVRIISVPNGGVAKARNTGLRAACGEFVAFLDADDLWHPTKIEHQLAAMGRKDGEYQQPAAVYALCRVIDTEDRVAENGKRVLLSGYSFARFLYARPTGNGSSILVRREAALAAGGFNPAWAAGGMGGSEDLDFELRIAARYPITSVGLYLVGYRAYPGNMSSNSLPMALGALATVGHHIELCPELPGWAARSVRASILGYAIELLIAGRYKSLALQRLATLICTDFARGIKLAAPIAMRKLGALIFPKPVRELVSDKRPLFYDLSPESLGTSSGNGLSSADKKILDRLEAVDQVLARRSVKSTMKVADISIDFHQCLKL